MSRNMFVRPGASLCSGERQAEMERPILGVRDRVIMSAAAFIVKHVSRTELEQRAAALEAILAGEGSPPLPLTAS